MQPTPLSKIQNFWENTGIKAEFFVKDESVNPFGTIKDRRNEGVIKDAARLKVDKLVLITSGSNGYSLCQLAAGLPIKVVCFISKDMNAEIKEVLKKHAYQVIELNLEHKILRPEELIAFARETDDEVIWDVTNGYEDYYAPIMQEILEKLVPDYIVVPLGSGGIFVGLAEEAERLNLKTKVIGIGVQNSIHSLADKLSTPWTPYAKAIEAYQKFGHLIYRLSEEEVKTAVKNYKNIANAEVSSLVVFNAPVKHQFKKSDNVVFINSGKIKF